MATTALCLIPQPKQVVLAEGRFAVTSQTRILLLPGAGHSHHASARRLQDEVRESTGLRLPIIKASHPTRRANVILLIGDLSEARAFWGELPSAADRATGHGEQAHFLSVTPQVVIAGGQGDEALHYAVQTLRQIIRTGGTSLPAVEIADWPSLRYRGLMLDVCRGKVPTLETLKLVVDQISLYKANVLQLYTEHTFVFPHHPCIGEGCGSLSGEDIMELDEYAAERHVELMPNLQSFGHFAHILRLPEYEHLAESPARWSLSPVDEDTYQFLDELYADLLPAFRSETFNIGCDETWDLGLGRSAGKVKEEGTGRVYLRHILRLRELAQRYGRRIQLWGDILLHYPELVSELPEDVTLLDWHYEAEDDYPSVRLFAQSGRRFWVCPGTSSWNTLFPRIENANANIRNLARQGAENGAEGLLNTDWGDHGHYQPLGQCWYGYVYGAAQAWTGGTTTDAEFDANFGRLFFGEPGVRVVGAMRRLARLNTLPGMALMNASRTVYALLDEPLVGALIAKLPGETLEELERETVAAEEMLRGALASSRDRLSVEEMIYSAQLMSFAVRKLSASRRVRYDLQRLRDGQGDAAAVLRQARGAYRALDVELQQHVERFQELWLRRAHRSEIAITLGHFQKLRGRLEAAQQWLGERLQQVQSGGAPDYDLSAYEEGARSYEILGQSFWREMREAGMPA